MCLDQSALYDECVVCFSDEGVVPDVIKLQISFTSLVHFLLQFTFPSWYQHFSQKYFNWFLFICQFWLHFYPCVFYPISTSLNHLVPMVRFSNWLNLNFETIAHRGQTNDQRIDYLTVKPSDLKHSLCNSISRWQSLSSSPLDKMQASRACFVSGQQQQIFLPDLMPTFCMLLLSVAIGGGDGAEAEFPMLKQ